MKKLPLLILAVSSLFLGACASTRPMAHFAAPSTAPVQHSAEVVQAKVASAQGHAAKAKAAVQDAEKAAPKDSPATLTLALKLANDEIDSLSQDLISAQTETAVLQSEVHQLDTQITDMTKTANAAIDQNNKLINENAALKASVSKWRALALKLIAGITIVVLGALLWIFRKPIMMMVGIPPI